MESVMRSHLLVALGLGLSLLAGPSLSQTAAVPAPPSAFDPALAQRTGADPHGMRAYVLVVLKTGPQRVPDGPARQAMFAGHFANIKRLSEQGHLVLAGPFDGEQGWRGLFVFATDRVEQAQQWVATDPVIQQGEMVAEFHPWYGSAAAMLLPELHPQVVQKPF
jgi:uncharacterized protein YciI